MQKVQKSPNATDWNQIAADASLMKSELEQQIETIRKEKALIESDFNSSATTLDILEGERTRPMNRVKSGSGSSEECRTEYRQLVSARKKVEDHRNVRAEKEQRLCELKEELYAYNRMLKATTPTQRPADASAPPETVSCSRHRSWRKRPAPATEESPAFAQTPSPSRRRRISAANEPLKGQGQGSPAPEIGSAISVPKQTQKLSETDNSLHQLCVNEVTSTSASASSAPTPSTSEPMPRTVASFTRHTFVGDTKH